jgi:hypothetical protein
MQKFHTCLGFVLWAAFARECFAESRLLLRPGDSLPSIRADAVVEDLERLRSNRFGGLFITADASSASGAFAGVWRTDVRTGQTILVVEDSAPVPGIDDAFFDEPSAEEIGTDVGQDGGLGLLMAYSTQDLDASGFGTWYWDVSSGLTQLLLHYEPAPGFADQLVYDPEIGSVNGTAGLANVFADTAPTETPEPRTDATWLRAAVGDFHLVAVTGTPAPGLPNLFLDGEPWIGWINNQGQFLLDSEVNASGGAPNERRRTIWLAEEGVAGPLSHVLTRGDELPLGGGTVPVSGFGIDDFNNHGNVALSGFYPSGDDTLTGLWTFSAESGFRHVVSEGASLPGLEPFNFEQLAAVDLSDDGELLIQNNHPDFHAHYGAGLWLSSSDGGLEPVILAGQPAPETETVFSDFGTTFRNANGQIAVAGSLGNDTPFDPSDDEEGIWAQDTSGDLRLIAREGSLVDVGGGQFVSITDPSLIGIDDLGYVVFSADLGNGAGRAAFVSDVVAVPEPSTMTHVLAAFLLLSLVVRGQRAE